ncbi:unnamed protein product [Acanthoscelides obtectus]|uniref:Uncharacterized protein n=1 Tax=Acanthoscelides obtectus TaxID=200917 RepID=A0A9P0NVF5_ACAOB|nr:unnamed protein product [Acanthoscelides obtectus]CAK1625817.1 hypothetical protein AOBTE_LOCUS3421 [Acanthoscelides obtectus]
MQFGIYYSGGPSEKVAFFGTTDCLENRRKKGQVESVQENVDSECPSQAQPTTDGTESLTQNEKVACSSKSGTVTISRSRPGKNNYDSLTKDVLTTVQEHFKRPRTEEDRFDVFGKTVAMKLHVREVDKRQSLIAEKIINDVIFEAELGGLTLQHRCVNMQEMYNARNPNMQQHQPLILPCQSASNSTSYSSSTSFISTPATSPNCQFQQNNSTNQQQLSSDDVVVVRLNNTSAASYFTEFTDDQVVKEF